MLFRFSAASSCPLRRSYKPYLSRACLAAIAWLACCASSVVAQPADAPLRLPSVKLGVVFPLTGGSADFGQTALHGVQLAVDEINAYGGYLGRKLELVVKDDRADPETGLKASQELVAEKVLATIGFCNTGVAMRSIEVYQNAKTPLIVPCSTGTPITAKYPARESYIFRNAARDSVQAPFVVDDILKRGWGRVAIFADSTVYGESGMNEVSKALAAKGLKPVYTARFALGVKDLHEEMKAARAAGANVIFSYTVGPENATIANSKGELNWRVPMVGAWPLSFPSFIQTSGEDAEGALMSQTFIAEPSNERRASFLTAYARRFNTARIPVPMAAAQSYDATFLLLNAMFAIRNAELSGPSIKAALEDLPRIHYGVVTTYDKPFSPDDKDAITRNMLVMGVVKRGAVTFAYQEDAKKRFLVQRKQ